MKLYDLRRKHVKLVMALLSALDLDHLIDDVYDALKEKQDRINFDIERIDNE